MGAETINDPWAMVQHALRLLDEGRSAEALKFLHQAAEKEHRDALLFLAEIYREGALAPRNLQASANYYERAAAKNGLPAIRYLALHGYVDGMEGALPKDAAKAQAMLEKGAVLGDPRCMLHNGLRFLSGDGVTKDEQRGIMFLEGASRQGEQEAAFALALYFEKRNQDGDGVRVVHWLTVAAELSPKAAMWLARIYMEGKLVKRDMRQALQHAVFAAGFEGEDGEAARRWLRSIEANTGRKIIEDDEEGDAEAARRTWEEETAIEEERQRRAALNAGKAGGGTGGKR